jgi:hypothetical protein
MNVEINKIRNIDLLQELIKSNEINDLIDIKITFSDLIVNFSNYEIFKMI